MKTKKLLITAITGISKQYTMEVPEDIDLSDALKYADRYRVTWIPAGKEGCKVLDGYIDKSNCSFITDDSESLINEPDNGNTNPEILQIYTFHSGKHGDFVISTHCAIRNDCDINNEFLEKVYRVSTNRLKMIQKYSENEKADEVARILTAYPVPSGCYLNDEKLFEFIENLNNNRVEPDTPTEAINRSRSIDYVFNHKMYIRDGNGCWLYAIRMDEMTEWKVLKHGIGEIKRCINTQTQNSINPYVSRGDITDDGKPRLNIEYVLRGNLTDRSTHIDAYTMISNNLFTVCNPGSVELDLLVALYILKNIYYMTSDQCDQLIDECKRYGLTNISNIRFKLLKGICDFKFSNTITETRLWAYMDSPQRLLTRWNTFIWNTGGTDDGTLLFALVNIPWSDVGEIYKFIPIYIIIPKHSLQIVHDSNFREQLFCVAYKRIINYHDVHGSIDSVVRTVVNPNNVKLYNFISVDEPEKIIQFTNL